MRIEPIRWIVTQPIYSSGTVSNNYTILSKTSGTGSACFQTEKPATRGTNSIELKITNDYVNPKHVIASVGVHPQGQFSNSQKSVHFTSYGITYNCLLVRQEHGSWLIGNTVRIEIDFVADTIKMYCNNRLMVENDHKFCPSTMKTCYISLSLSTNTTARIISSNLCD
jgi:hypothetical protein